MKPKLKKNRITYENMVKRITFDDESKSTKLLAATTKSFELCPIDIQNADSTRTMSTFSTKNP